jgi:hypothetical protein
MAKLRVKGWSYVGNVTSVTIFSYPVGPAQDKVFFRNLWPKPESSLRHCFSLSNPPACLGEAEMQLVLQARST